LNPKGSGKERRFSRQDLIKLKMAKVLFDIGISGQIIKPRLEQTSISFPFAKINIDNESIEKEIDQQIKEEK